VYKKVEYAVASAFVGRRRPRFSETWDRLFDTSIGEIIVLLRFGEPTAAT
jgi:hypothetical protein